MINFIFYGILFFCVFFVGCAQKLSDGSTINTNTNTNVNPNFQYNKDREN